MIFKCISCRYGHQDRSLAKSNLTAHVVNALKRIGHWEWDIDCTRRVSFHSSCGPRLWPASAAIKKTSCEWKSRTLSCCVPFKHVANFSRWTISSYLISTAPRLGIITLKKTIGSQMDNYLLLLSFTSPNLAQKRMLRLARRWASDWLFGHDPTG